MEDARTLKSLYIDFSFSPKGLELWEGMIQNGKTVTFTRCTVTNPKSPGGGNTLLDARVYIPKVAMTLPKSRWDITSGLPRVTIDITALLSLFFKCHKMLKIGNPGISWRLGQKFIWRILFPPHNITHGGMTDIQYLNCLGCKIGCHLKSLLATKNGLCFWIRGSRVPCYCTQKRTFLANSDAKRIVIARI